MNARLANTSRNRATNGDGEQRPMYCARWVRQCLEVRYGTKYDLILAGQHWLPRDVVDPGPPRRPEDLLRVRAGVAAHDTSVTAAKHVAK